MVNCFRWGSSVKKHMAPKVLERFCKPVTNEINLPREVCNVQSTIYYFITQRTFTYYIINILKPIEAPYLNIPPKVRSHSRREYLVTGDLRGIVPLSDDDYRSASYSSDDVAVSGTEGPAQGPGPVHGVYDFCRRVPNVVARCTAFTGPEV